ncbi:YqaJ viral recombinase family protein [Aquihabitans sp. G128]|uniref:YqaJ viral recombinase family nuclease n=1 Tax=Aquihabitans sp. G128 TaxID=2849779 RepID=UPI001C22E3DF|nr:YqaJ viral recombinase family protein [Aquihabitans sp. G128]QXC59355.1 YqaJ viral recombinase family protein [Aquihabitans sp. G128]
MTLTEADLAVITAAPIIANTDELTRPDWLALRRTGLGGSDAAAALGITSYSSSYKLWTEKTSTIPDDDESVLAMRRGQHAEEFILREAAAAEPHLHVDRAPYMLRHPDHPELLANVDGLAVHDHRRGRGIFEAKNVNSYAAKDWADGPPIYYEAQVFHYMAVLGLDWAVVAADTQQYDDLPTYFIERDDAFIEQLVAREVEWWERHVVDGHEPTADGSKPTTDLLKLIEARQGVTRQLDPDEQADVEAMYLQLAHDTAVAKDAEQAVDTAKNRVRQLMGEATELVDADGRTWATWRQAKDKQTVDHRAAVHDAALALGVTVDELLASHSTTKPGARTLRTAPGLTLIAKET